MRYIFYGQEGSGKTTQANKLAKKLKLVCLSTGDLIRHYAYHEHSKISHACRRILEDGTYLDNDTMLTIIERRLTCADIDKGYILDGFPRNLFQAKWLDVKMAPCRSLPKVIYLKLDRKTAISRLMRRKRDGHDTRTKINSRLKQYLTAEKATVAYYRRQKRLLIINAGLPIEKVFKEITKAIKVSIT